MPRRRAARRWRALARIGALVALGACRVDATVAVTVTEDGSGSIEVTVIADADVVEAAPDLADDLRLDDLQQAGWIVEGPTAVEGGGLQLVLSHPFASTEEATALLGQLSGDDGLLAGFELEQQRSFARVSTDLSGSLTFEEGLAELADDDIVEQIGGAPYLATLADRGIPVEDAFGLRLVVTAPGEVVATDGTASPSTGSESTVTWEANLVGAAATEAGQPVTLRTALVDEDAKRARRLERFAPWALAAWVVFMVFVVVPVVALRRRRRASR
ncbi:MAG TPA: hypothetical protein VIT64_08305 [Ilumatobacteraceae bacterium]